MPFLDIEVVDLSYRTPSSMKVKDRSRQVAGCAKCSIVTCRSEMVERPEDRLQHSCSMTGCAGRSRRGRRSCDAAAAAARGGLVRRSPRAGRSLEEHQRGRNNRGTGCGNDLDGGSLARRVDKGMTPRTQDRASGVSRNATRQRVRSGGGKAKSCTAKTRPICASSFRRAHASWRSAAASAIRWPR